MAKTVSPFRPLGTLTTRRDSISALKTWRARDGSYDAAIQRFITLNAQALDFLGIKARIAGDAYQSTIEFETSRYIGVVPLLAPDTGLDMGVLTVTGRYGEQPEAILNLLSHSLRPEYNYQWPLTCASPITPPVFMECCAYVDLFSEYLHHPWNKFKNTAADERRPSGSTQWAQYALRRSLNPSDSVLFPNRNNSLSTAHHEAEQLNYVCQRAIERLSNPDVPQQIRVTYSTTIQRLKRYLRLHSGKPVSSLRTHASDPHIVKRLKQLANVILSDSSGVAYAWRLDYADFFERYVQYLLSEACKGSPLSLQCNPHYRLSSRRHPQWGLSYIEPDVVMASDDCLIIADAKYKSHIYNWGEDSEALRDAFRHDLHQVLAYTSVGGHQSKRRMAVLVYPYKEFRDEMLTLQGRETIKVHLIGVPMTAQQVIPTISRLREILK